MAALQMRTGRWQSMHRWRTRRGIGSRSARCVSGCTVTYRKTERIEMRIDASMFNRRQNRRKVGRNGSVRPSASPGTGLAGSACDDSLLTISKRVGRGNVRSRRVGGADAPSRLS